MDETEPPAKKIGQDLLFATKKKQPPTVSVKTKNHAHKRRNFEIWEHLDQMVYHQSCYKNYLSSARRSKERSQEEQKSQISLSRIVSVMCNGMRNKVKQMRIVGESPLNRNDPKSEQYSLDLLKRVIHNFQSVWRHRSELGFVPVKGTLPYVPKKMHSSS
jgi:hypothetical protein